MSDLKKKIQKNIAHAGHLKNIQVRVRQNLAKIADLLQKNFSF